MEKTFMEKSYRYRTFGVVISPPNSESINFLSKTRSEITDILRDLNFVTPIHLAEVLDSLKVLGTKKKNSSDRYFSTVESLQGQLELGSETNRPHYQIWLKFSCKVTKKQLVQALSLALFNEENSPAISVLVTSEDSSALKAYCQKEMRANLLSEFSDVVLSKEMLSFYNYLRSNPEAKEFLSDRTLISVG